MTDNEQDPESTDDINKGKKDAYDYSVDQDPTKLDFQSEDLTHIPKRIWQFILRRLSIKDDLDPNLMRNSILESIEFKGASVWILMFSIGIASIGLNIDSMPVVIGAMLISPLMGPIRGMGLAVATNDFKTLVNSLINFSVAVAVSLFVSWLYFVFSPLKEETPALLARTTPHILDVLVATFGGFAGMIAAKSGDRTTVVPGVAIATALMPPLCTAGYGLATGHLEFFIGAMYLFLLNALFIALSTIVVIRYLRFPMVKFVNKRTEKKVKFYILVFMVLVIIPSASKFLNVIDQTVFERRAKNFVEEVIQHETKIMCSSFHYDYNEKLSTITLDIVRGRVDDDMLNLWNNELKSKYELYGASIIVHQGGEVKSKFSEEQMKLISTLHDEKISMQGEYNSILVQKEEEIRSYKGQLLRYKKEEIDLPHLMQKVNFQFPYVDKMIYSPGYEVNDSIQLDTIPTILVHWNSELKRKEERLTLERLNQWLKIELKRDSVLLYPY